MKTILYALAALAALGFPATGQDAHPNITGEVFIVTGAGENVKLGRVEISALKPEEVAAAVKAVDEKYDPFIPRLAAWNQTAKQRFDAMGASPDAVLGTTDAESSATIHDKVYSGGALLYAAGALKYFRALPSPICTTKTDSDGKYDLQLPSMDAVVLAARADRPAVGEVYYWLVYFDPSKATKYTFSSDNQTDSGSSESVVSTVAGTLHEDEGEADIGNELKRADEVMGPMPKPKPLPTFTADEWKKKAIEQYPQLAVGGSPLNVAFVAKFKAYQGSNYFDAPDWPMRLAKECAEAMPAAK